MAKYSPVLTQAERLAAALDARGLSVREFAKTLAGDGATVARWEAERRQVQKWLGGQRMFPKSARRVATALGEPVELWLSQPRRGVTVDERLREVEARLAVLEAQLSAAVEQRQDALALLQELLHERDEPRARRNAH